MVKQWALLAYASLLSTPDAEITLEEFLRSHLDDYFKTIAWLINSLTSERAVEDKKLKKVSRESDFVCLTSVPSERSNSI